MNAMQTYEPNTAPAQAATAAGLVVSALRADALRPAAWLVEDAAVIRLFLAGRHRPTMGLEDAHVR
jgi:hypothetical protein